MGGWWSWALVSPDGMAPSRMVSVSASINLPLHHEVQLISPCTIKSRSSLLAPSHPGGPGKGAGKRLWYRLCGKMHVVHTVYEWLPAWTGFSLQSSRQFV